MFPRSWLSSLKQSRQHRARKANRRHRRKSGFDIARKIAVDADGNVHIAGGHGGPADFGGINVGYGGGRDDAFVTKLDAQGNFLWAHGFGAGGRDLAGRLDLDSGGNVYVSCNSAGSG